MVSIVLGELEQAAISCCNNSCRSAFYAFLIQHVQRFILRAVSCKDETYLPEEAPCTDMMHVPVTLCSTGHLLVAKVHSRAWNHIATCRLQAARRGRPIAQKPSVCNSVRLRFRNKIVKLDMSIFCMCMCRCAHRCLLV